MRSRICMRVVGISACGSSHIFKSIRTFTRVGFRRISCSQQKRMVSNSGRCRGGLDTSPNCILTPVACQSLPWIGTLHLGMECCRLLRRHKAVQVLVHECCGLSCSSYGYPRVCVCHNHLESCEPIPGFSFPLCLSLEYSIYTPSHVSNS